MNTDISTWKRLTKKRKEYLFQKHIKEINNLFDELAPELIAKCTDMDGTCVGVIVHEHTDSNIIPHHHLKLAFTGDVTTKKIEVTHYKIWRKRDEEKMS